MYDTGEDAYITGYFGYHNLGEGGNVYGKC